MIEAVGDLNDGQKQFLKMASRRGIDPKLFGTSVPEIKHEDPIDSSKPTIAYIHTGGTLMMVPSKKKDGALSFEGALDIPEVMRICDLIAGIRSRYNIIGVHAASMDSKEVKPELWTHIAATIYSFYDRIEGAVIGHGTHTLEYSSAGLAFALQNLAIPVVVTASQIPIIGYPGSDGLPNLTGAMEIAANGDIAEVVAYTHGEIYRGSRVIKKDDTRLDVFHAPVTGPLGYFTAGELDLRPGTRRRSGKRKHSLTFLPSFSKHVAALKIQPGMGTSILDNMVNDGQTRGIILETYGSGAIPRELVPIISKHVEKGYPIFVTSSCAQSGATKAMALHDEDAIAAYQAGIRNVGNMSTTATTVKLMHVLGNGQDLNLDCIRHEMTGKSYAGEVTLSTVAVQEDF